MLAALLVFTAVARRFATGAAPPDAVALETELQLGPTAIGEASERLLAAGLANRAVLDGGRTGLVPARPLEAITPADVIRAVLGDVAAEDAGEPRPPAHRLLADFRSAGYQAVGASTFRELVAAATEEKPPTPAG